MLGRLSSLIFDTDLDETFASCFPIVTVCFAIDLKTFKAGPWVFLRLLLLLFDDLVDDVLDNEGKSVTTGDPLFDILKM